jgi:AmmeMemoRadiSam system protein A
MPSTEYSISERQQLLGIARASMSHGVNCGSPLPVDLEGIPEGLARMRASFVTLYLHGALRGCTGSLEATQPLAVEVAQTACASALSDPRFFPVSIHEVDQVRLEVSVLSPLTPIAAASESALLEALEPGTDGLVLALGNQRATFLPAVWEQLPEPARFIQALKQKAGLPEGFWSSEITAFRYHTETFTEHAVPA